MLLADDTDIKNKHVSPVKMKACILTGSYRKYKLKTSQK